jgi:HSP20 family protein
MSETGSQDGPRWPGFEALRREIDRAFEQVSGFPRGSATAPAVVPMDMVETENGYEITAELPGIDPGQVELTLAGRVLTLAGEKVDPRAGQKESTPMAERHFGAFSRAITLPDDADAGGIAAQFADGVLTIHIPKSPAAAPEATRIPIGSG